jgi:hypothetical protein
MPDTWYAIKLIKHIAAVVHRCSKYFNAPPTIFQLVRREWMVEFPRGAQKSFKDRAGRDANNRADAKFRGIVVGTLRGHKRSRLTVKLSGRAMAPDKRRGRTLSSSARGA